MPPARAEHQRGSVLPLVRRSEQKTRDSSGEPRRKRRRHQCFEAKLRDVRAPVRSHGAESTDVDCDRAEVREAAESDRRDQLALLAQRVSAFAGDYGKSMMVASGASSSSTVSGSWGMEPEEAWNIDTKMDDGVPNRGRIWSNKGNGVDTFCSTVAGSAAGADTGAAYALTITAKDCGLYFLGLFPG